MRTKCESIATFHRQIHSHWSLPLNSWLFSFYFPARSFCRYHSKFSCWKLLPKKQKEQRQKQPDLSFSDVFSLPVHFEFFAIFSHCLHFAKFVCLLKRLQRLKQECRKVQLGPGKHTAKTRFGLEK
jgi:hypothetical protein